MAIEKEKRYIRLAPDGDKSVVNINTDEELSYHRDLEEKGFTYTEVEASAGEQKNVCINCEG